MSAIKHIGAVGVMGQKRQVKNAALRSLKEQKRNDHAGDTRRME